jgi:CPA2 family monovalent cation:H+ antiporter-2
MLIAAVISLIFKLLKQPVVLGYIVAGIIIGPYLIGDSWISNEESVKTWGEIGVLFLLFAMGLEFSFKKLLQMGSTALIAASVILIGMMFSGFVVGRIMGWNEMNSLFLGGMISMSSTTIVFKALDDMGLRSQRFAKVCFSILIVEDIFAVVLMVLLSSIATSRSFEGKQLVFQVAKLVAYIIFWFFMGIVILPTFLRTFRKHLSDELITILSVGLCLGMVLLAVGAGFSSALGAFVMGSLLAETIEAERIETLIQPIKNVFGAIFFVSVGMMINPSQLALYWMPILIISLLVIGGQIIFATSGTILSGQSLKVSLQTGFSLVQVGEFAFIIATLGTSLKVIDENLYPIIVAVSVLTTFLTPFIMKLAAPAHTWLEKHLPKSTLLLLEKYSNNKNTVSKEGEFYSLFKKSLTHTFIYTIVVVFIQSLFFIYLKPFIRSVIPDSVPPLLINLLSVFILLLLSSPFIWSIAMYQLRSSLLKKIWGGGNTQKAKIIGVVLIQIIVSVALLSYAVYRHFSLTSGIVVAVSLLILYFIIASRTVRKRAQGISDLLDVNLYAREKSEEENRVVSKEFKNSLLNYDIHISDFKIGILSNFCGKTLSDIRIREKSGVSVLRIVRNGMNINIPGGKERLFPEDKIVVAGSDEQIALFDRMLTDSVDVYLQKKRTHVNLERFRVSDKSKLVGVSILNSKIREAGGCIVMAIERSNEVIMNPKPDVILQVNDVLVVAGETEKIHDFESNNL